MISETFFSKLTKKVNFISWTRSTEEIELYFQAEEGRSITYFWSSVNLNLAFRQFSFPAYY